MDSIPPNPPEGGRRPRLAYRIKEAADELGISETSVRRLIKRGEIRANRKLRHILIPPTELERFMDLKN